MTLLKKIKDDQLLARKERDTVVASLLTTLYAEAVRVGKDDGNRETTDKEVVAVIKKFLDNNKLSRDNIDDTDRLHVLAIEEAILNAYMPAQLSTEQLKALVDKTKFPQIGDFMKYLKDNHAGEYDAKLASTLYREG